MPLQYRQFDNKTWGFVPPSSGSTSEYLRGDGTWGAIPAPAEKPSFGAYASVATNLPASVWTKITFGTEEFDSGGLFNPATSRVQFAGTGVLLLISTLTTNAGSAGMAISLYKNGAEWKRGMGYPSASTGSGLSAAWIVETTSVDYWEVYGYQETAAARSSMTGRPFTFFQGALLRS